MPQACPPNLPRRPSRGPPTVHRACTEAAADCSCRSRYRPECRSWTRREWRRTRPRVHPAPSHNGTKRGRRRCRRPWGAPSRPACPVHRGRREFRQYGIRRRPPCSFRRSRGPDGAREKCSWCCKWRRRRTRPRSFRRARTECCRSAQQALSGCRPSRRRQPRSPKACGTDAPRAWYSPRSAFQSAAARIPRGQRRAQRARRSGSPAHRSSGRPRPRPPPESGRRCAGRTHRTTGRRSG